MLQSRHSSEPELSRHTTPLGGAWDPEREKQWPADPGLYLHSRIFSILTVASTNLTSTPPTISPVMASFLSLLRTSQLEAFYFPLALKASPLPERPPRLPLLISSLPLPNHPIIFTCLGRAVSSRERGPSAGMMPHLPLDPLSVPWTELCAVLHPCGPSSLSPSEGGSARPGTLSLSSGDSSTSLAPLPPL